MTQRIWYSIVFICVLLSMTAMLFANEEEQIFSDEKKTVVEAVYSNPNFLPLIDVEQAKITLVDLSKSFQQLSDEYSEWDDKRQELEDEYSDIQVAIERIIFDMEKTKWLVTDTLTKISLFKKQISDLKWEVQELEGTLWNSKDNLTEYTTFLYKLHNDFYGKDLNINDIKLLVKSDNIADTLSSDHLVQMLTMKLTVLLDLIRTQQVSYTKHIMDLNRAKLAYQNAWRSLKRDLEELQQQKSHFYELLSYLKASRDEADNRVGKLRLSRDELEWHMSQLQQATNISMQNDIQEWSPLHKLLQVKDRDDGNRYFSRPIMPVKFVQYYFNDPYYAQEYGESFQWISLEVEQWSELYAPAPGIVYKAYTSDDVSLSWLVLVHKHWYISFYRPLSEVFVKPGQLVKRWEIIWRTGGQPGTNGAGLDAESPHLVFELMKNGEAIDPYSIMDISIFESKEELPQEYRMKYLQDYFARQVNLNDIEVLPWNTILERRDAFLNKYATGPYRDPSLWYDGSSDTGIDPIFGICIGFAETSFRNFKTTYNIGNVWNDDSWNTVTYGSPLAWVKALYNVLNNQYLWGYYTINELSRFWNTDWYIYASSPYNWQKNIMKCMSAIYDYPVPEDYPFRSRIDE